jgi:hypothetical protein
METCLSVVRVSYMPAPILAVLCPLMSYNLLIGMLLLLLHLVADDNKLQPPSNTLLYARCSLSGIN